MDAPRAHERPVARELIAYAPRPEAVPGLGASLFRLRDRFGDGGILRGGLALSMGGALRLSIGFLTWLAAARLYPVGEVGLAASAVSAVGLCAQIGLLGVDLAVIRLFPSFAGRHPALVNSALTVAAAGAIVTGLAFLLVATIGLESFHGLVVSPADTALLLGLILLQAVWWVMDQAAVAMQRSQDVLARAIVDSVVTLGAVIALGIAGPATATQILLAWVVAASGTTTVGLWQLRRGIPGYRPMPTVERSATGPLIRVGARNFVLYAAENAPGLVLPLIAAEALSTRAAAYWFSAWSMTTAVQMVAVAFGLNLFAAAAAKPEELRRQVASTLRSAIVLSVVAALLLGALGPLVLRLLGAEYADHATGPLRLLAVAALPMVVLRIYLAACRATDRTREATLTAWAGGVSSVALALVGAHLHGLTGMALGWLVGQVLSGAVAGVLLLRLVRRGTHRSGHAGASRTAGRLLWISRLGRDAKPLLPLRLHALVPLVVAGAWLVIMRSVPDRLGAMNDTGLVSVLPAGAIALVVVLTLSFCLSLARRPVGVLVPLLHVLVLVGVLYGVTTLVEADPRLETVYRHVGVMDYLLRHHGVDPNIDAYFNWPGFFAFGAVLTKVAGFGSPLAFAAWGPLAFNLLFLAPLLATYRWATDDARAAWAAVWVFYVANWVGQDYIAPQALGFALWLAMLAILLRSFTPPPAVSAASSRIARLLRRAVHPRRLAALRPRPEAVALPISGQRGGLIVLAIGIFTAIVTGHQLTPFAVVLGVVGLVLFARMEARTLPVVLILITAAWLAYVATAYLRGNIVSLTSSVGSVGGNFDQTVTGRLQGSAQHMFIVQLRLFASAAIWGLAVLGFLRQLRAGRCNLALAAVGLAPFLLPALQPYGGEMLLRVFLFALPAAAFFIAGVVFPSPNSGRSLLSMLLLGCLLTGLLGAFLFTRYGNERLDHFNRGDVQAVRYVYDRATPGTLIFGGGTNLPWRYREYETLDYQVIPDLDAWRNPCLGDAGGATCVPEPKPRLVVQQILDAAEDKGAYVIITESTKIQAALLNGLPGTLEAVAASLRTAPRTREVLRTDGAEVFHVGAR